MSHQYSEIPPGGIMNVPPSIPTGMLYRCKSIAGVSKQTFKLVPLSGQTNASNGQKIIESFVPFIKDIFRKNNIQEKYVLNYTEGDTISNMYPILYQENLNHVKEKTLWKNNLGLYDSLKHGLIIINIIRNTFDDYKKHRLSNPDVVPIGLCNLPMDSKYIKLLAYDIYELPHYVSDKKHRYYAYINAVYQNIIKNESVEKYEQYINGMLSEVKPFFTEYLSYFNFHEMIDKILEQTLETRLSVLNQYSAKIRKIFDHRVINHMPNMMKEFSEIKMIIIVCGESHFYNLHKLIKESGTFMMESEFLDLVLRIYDLASKNKFPNLLRSEDGLP